MKLIDAAAELEALGNPTRLSIYRTLVRAGEIHSFASFAKTDPGGAGEPGEARHDPHLSSQLSADAGPAGFPRR